MSEPSAGERTFMTYWRMFGDPELPFEAEHRFASPRRWRFDFAWPGAKVAVEIEGGVWTRGRHTRGKGFEADCEKYNRAAGLGWAVLRFTPGMLERDPVARIAELITLIEGRLR